MENNYTEAIKKSKHLKNLDKKTREKAIITLELNYLEWNKELKAFLCIDIKNIKPRIHTIKKENKEFKCSCEQKIYSERIPQLANCEHEAALYLAFKTKKFR